MAISTRTPQEVRRLAVVALGLDDESIDLDFTEALCASLRRAASFLCPATPRALVDTVLEALAPLVTETPAREDLNALVDQLVSTGDLLELADVTPERTTRLLFLGPPSYVERASGQYLLTGIRPLGVALVPADIPISYEGHARTVVLDAVDAELRLRSLGLHKIGRRQWAALPAQESATDHVARFQTRLDVAKAAGSVLGLTIMDPSTDVTYYRGRWRVPQAGDSGEFVGRRPQAYGADLWSVVALLDGVPERLLDLPLDNSTNPARDDAWRLQAAIDYLRHAPVVYRLLSVPGSSAPQSFIIDFFSPLPTWAERYLELVGSPVDKSGGALFSYRVPTTEVVELESMLTQTLWMTRIDGESL